MLDEIQTGNGRTGKWFAYQHEDIIPDVITTAKGLGNGVPIGACLARGPAAELFGPGTHGSTFGGNPLACATALQVLDILEQDELLINAAEIGQYIQEELRSKLANYPLIKEVRGSGLMIGIELTEPCAEIVDIALAKKLLLNVTASNVIRILPPLITNKEEAENIVSIIHNCIISFNDTL